MKFPSLKLVLLLDVLLLPHTMVTSAEHARHIIILAMSLCCLHTHMLKFSILETSMYTTLTGSNPPTLMLGELRRFISLFLTNWNKLSNILHVFLIVMTMQQTLLTYSLHLTLRTMLFFFLFFYEGEHRTGTMCPFSSLHPLRKGKEV